MVAWSLSSFRQISSTDFCTPYRKKYHTPLAQDNVLEFFIAGATLVDDVGPWVPDTMVFACDDRVSGGPMGRYARLALAEREEIVLLRRGGGAAAGWPERRAGTKRPSAGRWPETRSPLARGGAIVHRPPSVAASPEGFPACGPGSSTASEGRGLCGVLSCGSIGRPGGSRAGSRSNGRD